MQKKHQDIRGKSINTHGKCFFESIKIYGNLNAVTYVP